MGLNSDDDIPMSFVSSSNDASSNKLDQLDPLYMYTQILKEILLTIKFDRRHFIEFIAYCGKTYSDQADEMQHIETFEKEYRAVVSVQWYTKNCFLYRMVNRSLRTMDVDVMIKVGFFIGDLHRRIEQSHTQQFGANYYGANLTLYRGQKLSKTDFKKFKRMRGGLLAFNNFLSTSRNREASVEFIFSRSCSQDQINILFVMEIDPSKTTAPFADIGEYSHFQEEDEVLFAMHTVFRIGNIVLLADNENRAYQVNLTLTGDDDKQLRALTERIRVETCPNGEGWERMGELLLKIGQWVKAEHVYQNILQQKKNENDKAAVYHQLAWAKHNQGQHEEAMKLYHKSLDIKKRTLPANDPQLGAAYNNIGETYRTTGEHAKALLHFQKAAEIFEEISSPTDQTLAKTYSSIGSVYCNMDEHSKAISFFKKSINIFQKALPPDHPHLKTYRENMKSTKLKASS